MDRLRSAPTWLIGVLAGIAYAVLWWGAVGLALVLARTGRSADEDDLGYDGIGAALPLLGLLLALVLAAHVTWTIGFAVFARNKNLRLMTVVLALLLPAVIAAALLVAWGLGPIGFVSASIVVPIIASTLILAGPDGRPAARR